MLAFIRLMRKFITVCNGVALKIATVMLMFMLGIITVHVTMRYFVGHSITWSEEICRFMMIWISFLLFPLAQQKGQNIAVDFFVAPLRYKRVGVALAIVVELLAMLVLAVCIKFGWEYMIRAKLTVSEALGIPMYLVYTVLPYSFVMTFIVCVERLFELVSCLGLPGQLKECDDFRSGDAAEEHV